MEHSFNTEIAEKYGIISAVLYNHFLFWIRKNKADNKLRFVKQKQRDKK